ncbi:MAG: alpha/beta hydrolase [Paludibacter sp.]|nr:alpha/beta hydrolase [Paludibacter sp.]
MKMRNTFTMYFMLIATGVFPVQKYIWLHGLEGQKGSNTWDIYKQHLTNENGYIFEYESNKSIPAIAGDIYTNQISLVEGNDNLILIGHSMGGLVARSVQLLSPGVKGIITVGAANSGSVLLANTLNGKTYDYFSKAVRMVNAAVDKSLLSGIFSGPPVTIIALPVIGPINVFKDVVVNKTLDLMKLSYQIGIGIYALGHPCIRDMLPNSTYLRTLNAASCNVPVLNIYGSEDYWQVVRAVGTLKNVAEVKNPLNMDKNFDMEFVSKMQSALGIIYQIQRTHNLVYNALAVPAIFMPWIWLTRELVLDARFEWDAIYRYFETGIHADFATNMGSVEYRLQNYCIPTGFDLNKISCTQKYLPYIIENDGILSRKDVISPLLTGINIHNIRVSGVNHQEMGNHIEMRKLLEGIINYKTYGETFSR